jgi:LPXTG-motif cell wall-anchored protein
VDERLQTGQNPIEVAIPAIPQTFADAHGKSVAVGYVGDERVLGGPYPVLGIESCPEPEGPPECPPGTHEHDGQCVPDHEEPPVEPPPIEEPPAESPSPPDVRDDGSSSNWKTFKLPPKKGDTSKAPVAKSGSLPHTGAPAWLLVLIGSVLLGSGLALRKFAPAREDA